MSQYLIAYNNLQNFDTSEIHKVITTISTVTDWWHYLPNVYIVNTTSNAKYLSDKIIPHFQGLLFTVIKLDMREYNGVLNKDAWEWISKKNNQGLRVKVMPSPLSSNPLLSQLLPPITSTPTTTPQSLYDLLGIFKKK